MNLLVRVFSTFPFVRTRSSRRLSWSWLIAVLCLIVKPALAVTYTDNGDGTVTDPTTELTWMRCSVGQEWTGSTCTGMVGAHTWDQAVLLPGTVTFAGHSDWRLPNIRELESIVDRSVFDPATDAAAFPPTSSYFWSSTPNAEDSSAAWAVGFDDGSADAGPHTINDAVRLVRGGQSLGLLNVARPTADYVDHSDGTVTHVPTGLMWKRCAEGQNWDGDTCTGAESTYNWDAATLVTSTFAGKNDWRLPTVKELLTLVDYTSYAPALNLAVFPNSDSSLFWSASTYVGNPDEPWVVDFGRGFFGHISRSYGDTSVRMVRDGQSFTASTTTTATTSTTAISTSTTSAVTSTTAASASTTSTVASTSTTTQWAGASTIAMVAAGGEHSLALKADGTVVAFGSDAFGQLGQGRTVISATPVQARGLTNVESISLGLHTVALKSDGTVWSWGWNDYGQLGDGTRISASAPIQMPGVSAITMVAAGAGHTVMLKSDGTVWGVGWNSHGQTGGQAGGDEFLDDSLAPIQAQGLSAATSIAAGIQHTVALKNDGTVWTWGNNYRGELGDGSATNRATPGQVPGLSGVTEIASGGDHNLALKSDGTVWAWGSNDSGQLGDGSLTDRSTPVQVAGLAGVSHIAAGMSHSAALKTDGTVWAWGDNSFGQLGDGTTTNRTTPVQVHGLTGVTGIAAGGKNTAASIADGSVWVWGENRGGNLRDGTTINRATPILLQGWANISAISFGGATSVIKPDGTVWSWGFNGYGQLGGGGVTSSSIPVAVPAYSGATQIAAGETHALALKSDGSVWQSGPLFMAVMLGTGDTGSSTPQQVAGLTDVTAIAAGNSHNVVLKGDGTVWAWGYNPYGQLGDGSTTDRTTPVQASGLTGVTAIAAGSHQSLALKSDGSVWSWGFNDYSQQTCNCNKLPTQVAGISAAVAVAAGWNHSVALKSDGTVWAWGGNDSGQLGDGTTTWRASPGQVPGLTGVTAVAAAWGYSLALKSDGTVWAWGSNIAGRLGNSNTTDSLVPLQVQGLTWAVAIAAGDTHALAVRSDGTVWAWGRNASGNLGDGTYVEHLTAALVTNETVDGPLDLIPDVANSVPPEKTPPFFSAVTLDGSINASPTITNTTRFNPGDVGKTGAVFVTAMVPSGSLAAAQSSLNAAVGAGGAKGASSSAATGASAFVLVNLTASGWQPVVNGQLMAYATGVLGEQLSAQTLLENTATTNLKGAQFCLGYGTSAAEMSAAARMKTVVIIPGADAGSASTASCIVAGSSAALSYDLLLSPGWNLLGNSLNASFAVADLYGDADLVTTVWKWDTSITGWQFYTPLMDAAALQAYAASKGYGVLSEIRAGEGYWVNAKAQPTPGTQSGTAYELNASKLVTGWNLVATGDDLTPSAFNLSLGASPLTTLWTWNSASSQWYFYAPSLEAGGTLSNYIAGKGYLDFGSKTLGNGTGFWVNQP